VNIPVEFTDSLRQALRKRGFSFNGVASGSFALSPELHIETPANVNAELGLTYPLRIGAFTHLNGGFIQNVTIGRYCSFARDVKIGHGFHPMNWLSVSPLQYNPSYRNWPCASGLPPMTDITRFQWEKHTIIGSDVWLGNGVFVQDGVTIGDGAIVGSSAVVTRDVAPYAVVVGCPARQIRMRFPDIIVERLLRLKWWRYLMSDFGQLDFSDIHQALERIESLLSTGKIKEYQPEIIDASIIKQEWALLASPERRRRCAFKPVIKALFKCF